MYLTGNLPPLIIILGPTAIGKTGLAIELAQHLNGEIIGADSRQIYRLMDIGTAKPDIAQQALVPHHLIDVVNPDQTLSLAQYQDLTLQAIEDILQRGKIPFLVGGTGQYLTAIEEGWSIPRVPPNHELRTQLEAQAQELGAEAIHTRLAEVDPDYAQKTHPNNTRRVIRALEVFLETGQTMTVLQRKQPLPYRFYTIGLRLDRQILYPRADARVDQMMQAGFLAEVATLLHHGYHRKLPAMTALGYRELCMHLLDDLPLEQAIAQAKNNTHDFIRKQEIWFRGHDNGIMWHNVEDLDTNALITQIEHWIQE
jgi:tRNA dimethylallyltransferase